MKGYIYAILACTLAAGCSQESAMRDRGVRRYHGRLAGREQLGPGRGDRL